jgi:hypothetical protein
MKTKTLLLLWTMAGPLALLSTGCTTAGVTRDNARFLMPSMAGSNRAKRDRDQDFYEPPRNPQFNTARDQ